MEIDKLDYIFGKNKLWASIIFYARLDLSVRVTEKKSWLLIGKVSGQSYLSVCKWDKKFEEMRSFK